jgi:hypothetical protein
MKEKKHSRGTTVTKKGGVPSLIWRRVGSQVTMPDLSGDRVNKSVDAATTEKNLRRVNGDTVGREDAGEYDSGSNEGLHYYGGEGIGIQSGRARDDGEGQKRSGTVTIPLFYAVGL